MEVQFLIVINKPNTMNLRDELNKLILRTNKSDSEFLCGQWMALKHEYLEVLNTIQSQLIVLDRKIKDANCEVVLGGNFSPPTTADSMDGIVYHDKMQWHEKCEYVLRKFKKPMYSSEITDALLYMEHGIIIDKKEKAKKRRKIQQSVSGIMGADKKEKVRTEPRFQRIVDEIEGGKLDKIKFWLIGEEIPRD